jgi:4-diphosphocytidyl-2-C-methyl-D-erythritol kinase
MTPLAGGGFSLLSPAKVNLSLRILGRRADGFHDLDTIFQEIDLCDEIEFHPANKWRFRVEGGDTGPDDQNLIVRAARLLSEFTQVPCIADVVVRKRIPVGGGLGGGSSNGAIALHGLCRLWNLEIEWEKLQELAAELGSDCPFFVYGGLARGRGRGEKLELFDGAAEGTLLVVFPGFGVNTKEAFRKCEFPLTEPDKNVIFTAYGGDYGAAYALLSDSVNQLENIVLGDYPVLRSIREELEQAGSDVSLLSGSGSTVFGIFGKSTAAMHAAQQLRTRYVVHTCRMVGRQRIAEIR